ncbi:MAG: hypothetical protein II996_03000 [Oscillospiraceae bacterium]|nr:hypothetical protein [Oscillospiraceae bacterium]
MIRLKNIRINGNKASCEIFPEGSSESGYIIVDTLSQKVINYSLPEGYEWCDNHISHACAELVKISKTQEPITDKLVMWY